MGGSPGDNLRISNRTPLERLMKNTIWLIGICYSRKSWRQPVPKIWWFCYSFYSPHYLSRFMLYQHSYIKPTCQVVPIYNKSQTGHLFSLSLNPLFVWFLRLTISLVHTRKSRSPLFEYLFHFVRSPMEIRSRDYRSKLLKSNSRCSSQPPNWPSLRSHWWTPCSLRQGFWFDEPPSWPSLRGHWWTPCSLRQEFWFNQPPSWSSSNTS